MPTYEFRCPEGHDFEKFYKSISAAPSELACPECGQPAQRLISGGAGFAFKGSGFYLTDYGKNAHRRPEAGSPKTEGASGQAAKPAAESKPKADAPKAESREPKAQSQPKASPKPKSE